MKLLRSAAAVVLMILMVSFPVAGLAQTLYSWSSDEVVVNTDLNGNFTALKTGKVGSGVTVTNSDVASNAQIAHSKMATPALIPKAWAIMSTTCTGSAAAGTDCPISDSSKVTSITTNGASGVFRLNLAYTPANTAFAVFVTPVSVTGICFANTYSTSAPHALIKCFDFAGAANDVNQFQVLVMDT